MTMTKLVVDEALKTNLSRFWRCRFLLSLFEWFTLWKEKWLEKELISLEPGKNSLLMNQIKKKFYRGSCLEVMYSKENQ